jgi:alpha-beta hydrolase superfamily lysophospholipase
MGMNAAYPDADPAAVMSPEAFADAGIVDRECSAGVHDRFDGTTVLARNPMEIDTWARALRAASAGNRPTTAPVLVFQGFADQLVLQPLTDVYVRKACGLGDTIDYRVYEGEDHGTVVDAASDDVVEWFKARVDGDAARSTC